MSAGFLPDLQYALHSAIRFQSETAHKSASLLEGSILTKLIRNRAGPEPIAQSGPAILCINSAGLAGMSTGFLPDLQ